MNRTLTIILSVVVWLALLAYIVVAVRMCKDTKEHTLLSKVEIRVLDENNISIVTPSTVSGWLKNAGFDLNNIEIEKINTHEIKKTILKHGFIKNAKVYTNISGVLHIEVTQRRPIVRINTYNDYNFYITDDDWIMPIQPSSPIYVPIVTGIITFPFSANFQGGIAQLADSIHIKEQEAKRIYKSELYNISNHKRQLRSAERAAIALNRKEEQRINKKRNENDREVLLSALSEKDNQRRATYSNELKKIAELERQVLEKERKRTSIQKKEQQNYLYLLKLISFVKTINKNSFWDAQIVQINVKPQNTGSKPDPNRWIEPDIELIPRIGRHIVVFGTLEDVDAKLDKLMLFYKKVLDHEGWDKYYSINLKYRNQIVCRERKKQENRNISL